MAVSGIGGLEGRLAVAVQSLRQSAQDGQNALKLVQAAADGPAATSGNEPMAPAADPNAVRGTKLDIRV